MKAPLKIGIAGLGTVGAGVVKLLAEHGRLLSLRGGRPLKLVAVSARRKARKRDIDVSRVRWESDPMALATAPDIDVVVELIGGSSGVARRLVQTALRSGKHVVTANKALLAMHGTELAALAEKKGGILAFEAAVAGGIPIIKALREGLVGNRVRRLYGILNGTCNYILTTMRETGRDFDAVLAEAQAAGYAEADPSFDVDGIDAAHKLAVLTGAAFGAKVNFAGVHIEGIRHVSAMDIQFAEELGFRIKLLGLARETRYGIEQRVHPCMVPLAAPIAHIEGVFNAVVVEGDFVGTTMFQGRGAGQGPTASAVVADLVDVARGRADAGLRRAGRSAGRQEGLADGSASGRLLHAPDGAGPAGRDLGGVGRARQGAHLARIDAAARPLAVGRGAGGADHARDGRGGDAACADAHRQAGGGGRGALRHQDRGI